MNKIREYTNCCLELADFAMPSILIGTAGSLLANRILKYSPNVFVLAVAFSVSHLCNRYKYMDLKELAKGIKHITKNPKDFVSTWTIKKCDASAQKALIGITSLSIASYVTGSILRLRWSTLNPAALSLAISFSVIATCTFTFPPDIVTKEKVQRHPTKAWTFISSAFLSYELIKRCFSKI